MHYKHDEMQIHCSLWSMSSHLYHVSVLNLHFNSVIQLALWK